MTAAVHRLWAADAHERGPGRVHVIDGDTDKTFCGRLMSAVPGRIPTSGRATCQMCLNLVARRPESERRRQEYEARRIEFEQKKIAEDAAWWERYDRYLLTPEWAQRRALVFKRAGGMCEGCGVARASEVHHVTYAHAFHEFLWELRAICTPCHALVTQLDREARVKR